MNILLFNIFPEVIKDYRTFDLSNLVPILAKQYNKKNCKFTLLLMANIFSSFNVLTYFISKARNLKKNIVEKKSL
jgi:hypothetical protein